jgi:hypothetical protein
MTSENSLTSPSQPGEWSLKQIVIDPKTKKEKIVELAYGDPSSNAESMAFRRAAAKFNLGLYLYEKERPNPQYNSPSLGKVTPPLPPVPPQIPQNMNHDN